MLTVSEMPNPEAASATFWILPAIYAVFIIAIIVSILRNQDHTGTQKAIWVLIVIIAPVLGPLLWLVIGRRHRQGSAVRLDS